MHMRHVQCAKKVPDKNGYKDRGDEKCQNEKEAKKEIKKEINTTE